MAAAIPVIASFASAASAISAAGGIAAAMGTFTGFLSVAGAALTGLGALTGKKDLMKIGGLMSLGSGLANMASGASSAGAGAAGEQAAKEAFRASELSATSATNAAMDTAAAASSSGMDQAMKLAQESSGQQYADAFGQADPSGSVGSTGASEPIFDQAALRRSELQNNSLYAKGGASAPSGVTLNGEVMGTNMAPGATLPNGVTINGQVMPTTDLVTQSGSKMTGNTVDSLLEKFNSFGQNVAKNKELYSLGGQILNGMYGPEATALDYQKSIMSKRLRNMNTPIRLGFNGGGG